MNCDSAQLSCRGNIIIKQNELVFLFGLSRSYENDGNSVSFLSVRLRLFMKRDYSCFPYFEERSFLRFLTTVSMVSLPQVNPDRMTRLTFTMGMRVHSPTMLCSNTPITCFRGHNWRGSTLGNLWSV